MTLTVKISQSANTLTTDFDFNLNRNNSGAKPKTCDKCVRVDGRNCPVSGKSCNVYGEKKLGQGESLSVSDSRIHTMVKEIEEYNSNYDCDAF